MLPRRERGDCELLVRGRWGHHVDEIYVLPLHEHLPVALRVVDIEPCGRLLRPIPDNIAHGGDLAAGVALPSWDVRGHRPGSRTQHADPQLLSCHTPASFMTAAADPAHLVGHHRAG